MRGFARQSMWGMFITLLTVLVVSAQLSDCAALLEDALFAVEDNCDTTGRNEACYGYNQVSASFINEVPDDFFTQPSDISEIAELETLRTAALNLENETWGVALMNIQADLPDTLPGQNVTFMLMGDVEVENGVDPETAFQPSEGIEITVTPVAGANIRSGAGLNFNVIGGARPDETLFTDGVSGDGDWFRVAYNERVGWVNRVVFDDSIDGLDDLPVLSDELRTPMQAFYLRTGIGRPECEEAPENLLLVQGPENIEVNITANGADIGIGSTLILLIRIIDGEPFLEVIALAGEIDFMGVRLLPGQRSRACLGDEGSHGQDGEDNDLVVICDPTPAEQVENFGEDWCFMEQIPAILLNYGINILCPGETPVVTGGGGGSASTSNVPGIDCSSHQLISPLTPVNSGTHTFSWTGVQGNDISYQLVFYNFEGVEVESFWTSDTSYTLNLGQQTSTGGTFSWDVRIFTDNRSTYVCVSQSSPPLTRTGELNASDDDTVFSASHSACFDNGSTYETTVTWRNAPASPLTIMWQDTLGTPGSASSNAEDGSLTITTSFSAYTFQFINVSSGGVTLNLGAC